MVSGVRRASALGALWRAMVSARRGGPGLSARLAALPRLALATLTGRYHGLSRGRLALLMLAVIYIVSPIDIVPELIFSIFGLADDAVVAAWLAGAVLVETEAFLAWEADQARVVPGQLVNPPPDPSPDVK